jgi:hypothetical protein
VLHPKTVRSSIRFRRFRQCAIFLWISLPSPHDVGEFPLRLTETFDIETCEGEGEKIVTSSNFVSDHMIPLFDPALTT